MAIIPLKHLARHPGIWRVDGIGPIRPSANLGVRATVHFSGLTEAGVIQPYWKSSLSGSTLPLPIHTALLRDFKVGSLWYEGRRIGGPPKVDVPFRVDLSRARYVQLGKGIDLDGYWLSSVLPDDNFFLGENRKALASSWYAIVPVIGNRMTQWLVVSAVELLRFYVGVSSRFLSGALEGRLGKYIDWDKRRMEDGRPVLHVKTSLNRKEAAVLGRAVAFPMAEAALFGIHQHLSTIHVNNKLQPERYPKPLGIQAKFPFGGDTELRVFGKRMCLSKKGGKEQWAVFAMEILHCSRPMGFPGVVLESDDPWGGDGHVGGVPTSQPPPHFNPLLDEEEEDMELDDVPADKSLPRLVVRSLSNQFGGFDQLTFEHRRPEALSPTNQPGVRVDVPVNALTMEEGNHTEESKGNLGVSDFQSRVEQIDRDLSLFLEMLGALRAATKARRWVIETRKAGDGIISGSELITFFPEKMGKRRTWHLIKEPGGQTRPRQVVWTEIRLGTEGPFFYLLEMELKSGETNGQCTLVLYVNDFQWLDEKTFNELLYLTAVRNRWPDVDNKWKENKHHKLAEALFSKIGIHRINHPKTPRAKSSNGEGKAEAILNPKSWSAGFLRKIDELLPEFSDGPSGLS